MTTPGDRLRETRQSLGLSMESFGEPLEMSRPTISNWESGKTDIPKASAIAIQTIYGIRWEWLLKGEEPKHIEPQVTPPSRDVFVPVVMGLPYLGVDVPLQDGGEFHLLSRRTVEAILRRSGGGAPADLRLVRVPDDSMRPMLAQGDLVLVNTALELRRKPSPGSVCLVRLGGRDATVAFFRRVYLHPDRNEPALELVPDAPGLRGRVQPLDGEAVEDQILGVACL